MLNEFYGAIIGDMVGSTYKLNNTENKGFQLWQEISSPTDKTIQTLAVADTIASASEPSSMDPDTTRYEVFSSDDWRRMFASSIHSFCKLHFFDRCERCSRLPLKPVAYPLYNIFEYESAVRVSPVAWFARSLQECKQLARLSARATRSRLDGIVGAQAVAGAVYLALHGSTKPEVKRYVETYYKMDFKLDEIRNHYHFGQHQGTCAGTVPYAVEAFLESTDFEDCLRNAVSIGGDSGAVASIACAIAGAFYGLPAEYKAEALKRLPESVRREIEYVICALDNWKVNEKPAYLSTNKTEDIKGIGENMETVLKISEIARKLENEKGLKVSAAELNRMLVLNGDLSETAIGKVETKQGRDIGISGEFRQPPNAAGYWISLYNEQAVRYVVDLALEVFAKRLPEIVECILVEEAPQAAAVKTTDCGTCMLYRSGECGMPKSGGCGFYRPAYKPTEQDIVNMENASEQSLSNRKYTQNAFGQDVR